MTPPTEYVYQVHEIVKVTDGDTYWLRLLHDAGFRQITLILVDIRLNGWDCPEMHRGSDFEKQQAVVAQHVASDWLTAALARGLWIRTEKDPDDFGRWLGDLWTENEDGSVADHPGSPWPRRSSPQRGRRAGTRSTTRLSERRASASKSLGNAEEDYGVALDDRQRLVLRAVSA